MEVLPARGPDPGGGHASCGGAHLASADVCVLSLCLTMFTVEKSRLLAPESFLLTGSRGSVSDLLLLVLFVRLNLSSLSAWLPFSVSSNLVSTGFFVSSSVSGILTISAVCSRGLNSLNELNSDCTDHMLLLFYFPPTHLLTQAARLSFSSLSKLLTV